MLLQIKWRLHIKVMVSEKYTIKYSDENTSSDVIYDLMDIEKDVYKENERGHFDSIERRFNKNKQMFILLYDEDKIIGYLCFFPITKELHDRILHNDDFYDDNIEAKDVIPYGKENYIYFISIALYKKYQGLGFGKKMMDAFMKKLKEKESAGYKIKDILASAVSQQGERIAKKYGFALLNDMSKQFGYKLMYLEGDKIW